MRAWYALLCSKNEYTKSESNSQQSHSFIKKKLYCVQRTNIQNLKAIHNPTLLIAFGIGYCVQRTNIQNLKAIHNTFRSKKVFVRLCSKNEYTKSESNSQHNIIFYGYKTDCVQRTNIQNLKAIHNRDKLELFADTLCSKNEYTKSESNSQQDQSLCQFFAHFSCLAFSTL